jgi:pilus assembly protein CpaF
VSGSTVTLDNLIAETLSEDMLEFLQLAIRSGISMCFSGETGSGKTTLSGYLLKEAAKTMRTLTIEEGSREWDFINYDNNGKILNSVVHMKTRPSDDPKLNISQNKLLQIVLRFNPIIIAVGEMRSDEAFAATEAANTGHIVISTVHAGCARDAIKRIVTLCKKAYDFTDDTLMDMVSSAFPIQVYQEFLADGKRRVTEILEVVGYENGNLICKTLCEFKVEDNIRHDDGTVEVKGGFVWCNPISDKLAAKMLKKGATKAEIEKFASKAIPAKKRASKSKTKSAKGEADNA